MRCFKFSYVFINEQKMPCFAEKKMLGALKESLTNNFIKLTMP